MQRTGDQIGPYALTQKLGTGAFGVVWLAEKHTAITTTKVALKIPLNSEVDVDAIRQEADLWVRASGHPNVLPIIEADVYGDQVVIASEYAPDGSLESWLANNDGQAPSVEAALDITSGILAGLEHLHEQNIIHRDLKPANILLQRGIPRLADFGISRVLKSTGHSSSAAGTPLYMAPEAFDGKRLEQTDLWAAGVILYQLLTGRLPFPQTDMAMLLAGIITREPEPFPPWVPEQIRAIITRSLRKVPTERYQSAAEMRKALRAATQAVDMGDTVAIEPADPLAEIRRQMLVSNSLWQLQESLYKVDEFLSRHPHHTEARMTRDQITKAIQRETMIAMPAQSYSQRPMSKSAPKAVSRLYLVAALAAFVLLLGAALLLLYLLGLLNW